MELGYRPDPNLAVVARHRWRLRERAAEPIIALILETRRFETNAIGDNTDLPQGMAERADALGYRLEVFYRDDYSEVKVLERILIARGIRGLVVGPIYYGSSPKKDLDWNKFIAVATSPGAYAPPISTVRVDMFTAVTLVWDKVVKAGYKRLGAALYEHGLQLYEDDLRASAVHCCQKRRYPALPEIPTLLYNHQTPPATFRTWIETHAIDAVIGFNAEVYWQMTYAGIQIPEQVAFADLHVQPQKPPLAGILAGGRHSGEELIEMLHRSLLANAYGVHKLRVHHVVDPIWVDGETLPIRK